MVVSRKIAQPINAFAKMLADETYRVGYFVRLATTLLKTKKMHKTITFLLVTFPNIYDFTKSLTDSAINLS